jgi:hypothetical protein
LKLISILTFLFVIRLFFPSCQRTFKEAPLNPPKGGKQKEHLSADNKGIEPHLRHQPYLLASSSEL